MDAVQVPSPFPITRWTFILSLRNAHDPANMETALAALCQDYWQPLYLFARRQGEGVEEAKDLTQGFFAYALERELFAGADPHLGRLRSFLLTAFQRFLQDERKRERAQKRGGGQEMIPLDVEAVEASHPLAAATDENPTLQFERDWAHASLRAALHRLHVEEKEAGREVQYGELQAFLRAQQSMEPQYGDAAARLGMTEPAVRQAVSRLRKRFRVHLRQQISETLREPSEEQLEEELTVLRAALRW